MKIIAVIILVLALGMVSPASAEVSEIPAKRLGSGSPLYPASCAPAPGSPEEFETETVIVAYAITEDGRTAEIRVRESSSECFNEAAMGAVRGWRFEPRKVNGKDLPQDDMETTFHYKLAEDTKTEDFDARPIKSVPPHYPRQNA